MTWDSLGRGTHPVTAMCKAVQTERSDVLFQVIFARLISTTFLYAVFHTIEALIGGGKALRRRCSCSDARVGYRMSVCASRGCPCLTAGVSIYAGHKAFVGRSPAMVLAPAYECVCQAALSYVSAGMLRRAMSHMKPTSSRATAVVATVDFLPAFVRRR